MMMTMTVKKAEHRRIDAFELWCPSFFGRNDAKAEAPVLWPLHVKSWLIGKDFDAGWDWGQEEKGTTEDEMTGWHHWLNGRESEWTLGVGDGQGGLACCDSWGCKVGHDWVTELNWTECFIVYINHIFFILSSVDEHLGCYHILGMMIMLLWTFFCKYLLKWVNSLYQVAKVLNFQL